MSCFRIGAMNFFEGANRQCFSMYRMPRSAQVVNHFLNRVADAEKVNSGARQPGRAGKPGPTSSIIWLARWLRLWGRNIYVWEFYWWNCVGAQRCLSIVTLIDHLMKRRDRSWDTLNTGGKLQDVKGQSHAPRMFLGVWDQALNSNLPELSSLRSTQGQNLA